MAYRLPNFNILCDIYFHNLWPTSPRFVNVPCQLRHPEHVTSGQGTGSQDERAPMMLLLLPKLTDVRDSWSTSPGHGDIVVCPAGTTRSYYVEYVDDVAKGFLNEYRVAYLFKQGAWVAPVP